MSKFTHLTGTLFGLFVIATAASASAQISNMMLVEPVGASMWTLNTTPETHTYFSDTLLSPNNTQAAMVTAWPENETKQFTPINTKLYSRFDPTEFDYPIAGPIKLSIRQSYQRLLTTNNLSNSDLVATRAPASGEFDLDSYSVATTATTGFSIMFN
ncbi:MAG: hypothetical protein ACSHXY_04590 [Alphaproteobacteria bacterium]